MTVERSVDEKVLAYNHQAQVEYTHYLNILKQEFLSKLENPPEYRRVPDEFDMIQTLGAGAFGIVFLARDKTNFTYHAVKSFDKEKVIENRTIKNVLIEKKILESVLFPFIINMDFTCKDNCYVYFLLPFEVGGDLYHLLRKFGTFSETLATFYAAQLVLALEYLHHCNIVHRDVKPENIFMNENGYIKLGDLGLCKIIKGRTWTLCGTPEYLAPEIILSKGYSYSVDWWALGILIYEMSTGHPPFYSSDPMQLYEKTLSGKFKAPSTMNRNHKSLIKNLLERDPSKRYGSLKAGVYDIKSHGWFQEINWQLILNQKIPPPYVPIIESKGDTSNFRSVDEARLKKSPICLYEEEFKDF